MSKRLKRVKIRKSVQIIQVSLKCIKSWHETMGCLIKVKSIHSYLIQWSSLKSQMRFSIWRKELPIKNQSFWSRFRIWRGQKSHHKFRTSIRAFMGFHICSGRSLKTYAACCCSLLDESSVRMTVTASELLSTSTDFSLQELIPNLPFPPRDLSQVART